MKVVRILVLWIAAASAYAQMLPLRGTLILGAGKAGSWDTSIAVTNVDPDPLFVEIGPNLACNVFGFGCGTYTETTIESGSTIVLTQLPDIPGFDGPQAVYVRSSTIQRPPVASALVSDRSGECERSMSLPGVSMSDAFAPGDLVFSGISRNGEQYSNLIMSVSPPTGSPLFAQTEVHVSVRDAGGVEVGAGDYRVTAGIDDRGVQTSARVVTDFLRDLGIDDLDYGSVRLSPKLPGAGSSFAGVITVVGSKRAIAIQGARVP